MEMLRNGSRGEAVEALQQKLTSQGINPGGTDGIFGLKTEEAVKRYPKREGLEVDGIAGPITLGALGLVETEAAETHDLSDLVDEIAAKKEDDARGGKIV